MFFTNFGVAYTCRIIDVPASTGYGEPIQSLFKLKDGEKVVAALSLDPRVVGDITARKEGQAPPVHAVAVTSDGYSLRFGLEPFVEPSTRAGRRFARPAEGAEVVGVAKITGSEILIAATAEARGLLCKVDEVNYLSGPGKGVILIKLQAGRGPRARVHRVDRRPRSADRRDQPRAPSRRSAPPNTKSPAAAAKGRELLQRGQFTRGSKRCAACL